MLYNLPYRLAVGKKHPFILGRPYKEAWEEVWDTLQPLTERAWKGEVVVMRKRELFLRRTEWIQETYFTYSYVPVRDEHNVVVGLHNICFDNTAEILAARRLHSIHDLGTKIASSKSVEKVCEGVIQGMSMNPRDLGFVLMYTTTSKYEWIEPLDEGEMDEGTDIDQAQDGKIPKAAASRVMSGSRSRLRSDHSMQTFNGENGVSEFKLSGKLRVKPGAPEHAIPTSFLSGVPNDHEDHVHVELPPASPDSLLHYLRLAHAKNGDLHIASVQDLPELAAHLEPNAFGDPPDKALIMPIRASTTERFHGLLVIGLNTRLPYNQDYEDYLHLVRGFVVKGLSTVKLYVEEMHGAICGGSASSANSPAGDYAPRENR